MRSLALEPRQRPKTKHSSPTSRRGKKHEFSQRFRRRRLRLAAAQAGTSTPASTTTTTTASSAPTPSPAPVATPDMCVLVSRCELDESLLFFRIPAYAARSSKGGLLASRWGSEELSRLGQATPAVADKSTADASSSKANDAYVARNDNKAAVSSRSFRSSLSR